MNADDGDAMLRRALSLGSLLILSLTGSAAPAGPFAYFCEITSYLVPNEETGLKGMAEEAMDTPVAIDRASGMVLHPYIGNSTFAYREVLGAGSEDWSFRVIAYTNPEGNRHVSYIEVQEFAEGPDKPFLAVSNGIAYAGTCQ